MDPEMSADEILDIYLSKAKEYDFIGINFANGDIVGHTGSLAASIKAAEKLDKVISKIIEFCASE
jgi:2,3-bisphosphoglycerate-independent phosphoglycerate mutase